MQAQELAVKSFYLAETDLTANTPGTMVYDQNDYLCALIKVETTQKGFTFEAGMLNVTDVVEHPGEIWVYVPFGTRKITIKHSHLGILRDYQFPSPVEKGKTYIMKLISGSMRTVVEEVQTKQFLCIEVEPSDAFLELNGKVKFLDNGVYQELLPFGRYEYKVTAENYHEQTGVVNLNDPENASRITLSLKPAFGHVSVLQDSQSDIQGASVYIDNKLVGKIPVRDVQMSSGTHRIRVMAEMYEVYDDTFVGSDEEKKVLSPVLTPAYADVILNTADGAEIFVNGELKGASSWNGRLASGSYMIETRKSGHVPYKTNYDITAKDQSKVIQIQGPTPIYGSLAISSTPVGADISIDGKSIGEAPKYIPRQVIGDYTVTASMPGYNPQTKKVTVAQSSESSLSFSLEKETAIVNEQPSVSASSTSSTAGVDHVVMSFLKSHGGSYTFSKSGTAISREGKTYFKVTMGNDNQILVSVFGKTNASSFNNQTLSMTLKDGRATASKDALRAARYISFDVRFSLNGSVLTFDANYQTAAYLSFSIESEVTLDSSILKLALTLNTKLYVVDFKAVETDLTAMTRGTMEYDQNGNLCALIKISTSLEDLMYDGGVLGVRSLKRVGNETWLYVPQSIRKISIIHPKHGAIRDYVFPCAIKKGQTYNLRLSF